MNSAMRLVCSFCLAAASISFAQGPITSSAQQTAETPAAGMQANATDASKAGTGRAAGGDAAAEASLQKMENELSQAATAHDTAPFVKYIDDDILAFGPGWKATSKAEVLQSIKSNPCTGLTGALSDFAYKWVSPETVLVTYVLTGSQTCQGKTSAVKWASSSLWHKKGGNWVTLFHQETAVEPAPGQAPS